MKFDELRCQKKKILTRENFFIFRNYVKNAQSWTHIPQEVKPLASLEVLRLQKSLEHLASLKVVG